MAQATVTLADREPDVAPSGGVQAATVGVLVDELSRRLADAAGLAALDADGLRGRVRDLDRLQGTVSVALARTVAALADRGGVTADGAGSVPQWLQATTGRSARDAARIGRLATDIGDLPALARALADGRVGAEAADVIVRAARDGRLGSPDQVDATLVPVAEQTTPDLLRREVRRRQQAADPTALLADEHRQRARRTLRLSQAPDGMFDIAGRLPAEVGERARTLLDAFDSPDPDGTPDDQRRRPDQRLADAFDRAMTALLDTGDVPTRQGVSRPNVNVMVDLALLDTDLTDPARPGHPVPPDHPVWADLPAGRMEWGSLLSPQAARRILCDAQVSRIVTAGTSEIIDVGRATRTWPAPTRRAILARDGGCRGPACTHPPGWCRIHHVRWWERHFGPTDTDNGLALCDHCHHLIHDHGWEVVFDPVTGAATWTSPDRRRTVVTHPRR